MEENIGVVFLGGVLLAAFIGFVIVQIRKKKDTNGGSGGTKRGTKRF